MKKKKRNMSKATFGGFMNFVGNNDALNNYHSDLLNSLYANLKIEKPRKKNHHRKVKRKISLSALAARGFNAAITEHRNKAMRHLYEALYEKFQTEAKNEMMKDGGYKIENKGDGHFTKSFRNDAKPELGFSDVPVVCAKCGGEEFAENEEGWLPNRETAVGIKCKSCGGILLMEEIVPENIRPRPWTLNQYIELFYPQFGRHGVSPTKEENEKIVNEYMDYLKKIPGDYGSDLTILDFIT